MADPNMLAEIQRLLLTAASGTGEHKTALSHIESLKENPDFYMYCAVLLGTEGDIQDAQYQQARALAGYQLKNKVHLPACAAQAPAVQQHVFAALGSTVVSVRKAAVATVASAVWHQVWDMSVIDQIVGVMTAAGTAEPLMVGCSAALAAVTEQLSELLDASPKAGFVAQAAVPLMAHSHAKVRADALLMVSVLLEQAGISDRGSAFPTLRGLAGQVLQNLATIIGASAQLSPEDVARALKCLYLCFTFTEAVLPGFDAMVAIVKQKATDPADKVRMECLEFWRAVIHFPQLAERSMGEMPAVLSHVLGCMVFSAEEIAEAEGNANDWNVPDKEDAVKPKHYNKTYGAADGDDDDDDEVDQHTVRTVASRVLDDLAQYYGEKVLPAVLGVVQQRMQSGQWMEQESAILALGSISEGCIVGLREHLPTIISAVTDMLESESSHFLVHCICCFTLQCFAEWIFEEDGGRALLARILSAVVRRMQSPSKKLQEYATAALSEMSAYADDGQMNDLAPSIIATIATCLPGYQLKNRYLLFECTDGVAAALGKRLAEPDVFQKLMEPLGQLWQATRPDSPLVFPLYRCMGTVATATEAAIEPYVPSLFQNAFALMEMHSQARAAAAAGGAESPDDSDQFLIAGLDLFGSLCESLKSTMATYIINAGSDKVIQTLGVSAADESTEVRQSAFGVIGELCVSCVGLVQANLDGILGAILGALRDVSAFRVASNAAWSLGELVENQVPDQGAVVSQVHVDAFIQLLFALLVNPQLTPDMRGMAENVALTMGQLWNYDTGCMARQSALPLTGCLAQWCSYVRVIKHVPQLKERGMRGMLQQVAATPEAAATHLHVFLDCMASMHNNMPAELVQMSVTALQAVRGCMGAQWTAGIDSYDKRSRPKLMKLYGI